jgi:hypothetical protein
LAHAGGDAFSRTSKAGAAVDAGMVEMPGGVPVVQFALGVSVGAMHGGALFMVGLVNVWPMAMLGEVGLMLPVQVRALCGVLSVHGGVLGLVSGVELGKGAVRLPVALVLGGAKHARAAFAASRELSGLVWLLMVRLVRITHFGFRGFALVDFSGLTGGVLSHHLLP